VELHLALSFRPPPSRKVDHADPYPGTIKFRDCTHLSVATPLGSFGVMPRRLSGEAGSRCLRTSHQFGVVGSHDRIRSARHVPVVRILVGSPLVFFYPNSEGRGISFCFRIALLGTITSYKRIDFYFNQSARHVPNFPT